jgi:hypothetical protein
LGDDWVFLDYCIDCGHDERERFRITIPRCRTYAKKSANKRQEQRRRGSELMNWWTAFNSSVSFWHSLVLPPPQHKRFFGRSLEYTYHLLQCGFQMSYNSCTLFGCDVWSHDFS